ncbi:MAG TPA: STAS domain-containing protein [Roseiflexaceae bacterium]|nr:STAS domain-containing protein [Roseiflexaceae bacterium]
MSGYLTLPIIIFLVALATYVLAQDPRATSNRLFVLFSGLAVLVNAMGLARLSSSDAGVVAFSTALLGPLIALENGALVLLVLLMFIPQRYAERRTRQLIVAPYVLVGLFLLVEAMLGLRLVYVDPALPNQDAALAAGGAGRAAVIALFALGQIFPIATVATALVRARGGRGPALALLLGIVLSDVLSAVSPALNTPSLAYFGQVPLYLAFAWLILRYQLFRPSVVALQTAIESLPDGVLILDDQRRVRYGNPAARGLLGGDPSRDMTPLSMALERAELIDTSGHPDEALARRRLVRGRGGTIVFEAAESQVRGDHDVASIVVLRDISAAEQQAAALQQSRAALEQRRADLEQLVDEVRQRDELIAKLALPLIPIAEGVLVLPLIGSFDTRRSAMLLQRLLSQIESDHPHVILLDLTGVTSFDESLANSLRQTIEGTRLMGARVALCGVRPDLAESILHEQIDLREVSVFSTLQTGVRQMSR